MLTTSAQSSACTTIPINNNSNTMLLRRSSTKNNNNNGITGPYPLHRPLVPEVTVSIEFIIRFLLPWTKKRCDSFFAIESKMSLLVYRRLWD
mmetsp:Transcript_42183/g.45794  ORF Transcript_42183/g.45794 Transcript_42183/m.45794 type:complete len:92 (+) Transcript_42183:83-358(+)